MILRKSEKVIGSVLVQVVAMYCASYCWLLHLAAALGHTKASGDLTLP